MKEISEKTILRQKILDKRERIPVKDRSEMSDIIFEKLSGVPEYKNASTILFFVNYRSEVITSPYIKKLLEEGKKIYCPRVEGMDITFFGIGSMDDLKPGYQGIPEPAENELKRYTKSMQNNDTVIIVPGSVFDRNGNRMGYGKGFYDRFLKRYDKLFKIAPCYDMQIYDGEIPIDENDIRMDMIVSERQVIRIHE
ncbi:MAG: 5-formyltetrahydrofolate cyclo-ligase [Lachnospiraceae bacterium]|nr:5-formyltetrahydrofolate cyclo-ligase [Lachnospiraceae bacterium]